MIRRPASVVCLGDEEIQGHLQRIFDKATVLKALAQLNLSEQSSRISSNSIDLRPNSYESASNSDGGLHTSAQPYIHHAPVSSLPNDQSTSSTARKETGTARPIHARQVVDTTAAIIRVRQATTRPRYRVSPLRERMRSRLTVNIANVPREHRRDFSLASRLNRGKETYRDNHQIRVNARPTVDDEQLPCPTLKDSGKSSGTIPILTSANFPPRDLKLAPAPSYEKGLDNMVSTSAGVEGFHPASRNNPLEEYFASKEPNADSDRVW